MKRNKFSKILFLTLSLLFFPISVLAYSDYIIPGGENVGIEINSKGIMVIGFYKINGKLNKGTPEIKVGDQIIKVGTMDVSTTQDLISAIEKEKNS